MQDRPTYDQLLAAVSPFALSLPALSPVEGSKGLSWREYQVLEEP